MFNNKFNPDVLHSFENEDKSRVNTTYELKNIPYKTITKNNNNNITNSEDLKIKLKEDKEEVKMKFNKIIEDRKIKLIKSEMKGINNMKNLCIDINYMNEFNDLKEDCKSEFKSKKKDLEEDREKYNSIVESLLNEGLLG